MKPSDISLPNEWERINPESLQGTIMVIGESDTGKTTFARYLFLQLCRCHTCPEPCPERRSAYGRSEGRRGRVAFLDCDVGQSTLGLPTTMNLALSDGEPSFPPEGKTWSYFVGATSPRGPVLGPGSGLSGGREPNLAAGDTAYSKA